MSLSTLSICYCSLPAFESSLLDMMPALALLKLSHNNISFSLSGAGDRRGGGGDGMDGRGGLGGSGGGGGGGGTNGGRQQQRPSRLHMVDLSFNNITRMLEGRDGGGGGGGGGGAVVGGGQRQGQGSGSGSGLPDSSSLSLDRLPLPLGLDGTTVLQTLILSHNRLATTVGLDRLTSLKVRYRLGISYMCIYMYLYQFTFNVATHTYTNI